MVNHFLNIEKQKKVKLIKKKKLLPIEKKTSTKEH